MPALKSPDLEMHYLVDDCTTPWVKPETILLLHGCAESSVVWYGWVPHLSPHFRVVRPDMRGFGASTPMARDFKWTPDIVINDYLRLMDALGIERFHLVAAKIGGTIARAFAARHPDRVQTLTVVGTPQAPRPGTEKVPALIEEFDTTGPRPWIERTMSGRLGSNFPPEGTQWWTEFMCKTAVSTLVGFNLGVNYADISADLPRITCPTLVITTEGSGLGSVEQTRAWQQKIPRSTLLVLPGDSYHPAASDAERCAKATIDFIVRNGDR